MAERPIFIPTEQGSSLVRTVPIEFKWHPGMAPSQKKKNIAALHEKAGDRGFQNLLEISSKSENPAGQQLSAFRLTISVEGRKTTVECAFQASKIFVQGGPFLDLMWKTSREAKKDDRIRNSGRLVSFKFLGEDFPLTPPSIFYDWLYINALNNHPEWHPEILRHSGFTDIEFNPEKSINCQARSVAIFASLIKRQQLDDALDSFSEFKHYYNSLSR